MGEKWDAIVVGAGAAGLTAGTLLAREGRRTLIVERGDRVGGRALTFEGEEVSANGPGWYERLLADHYSYLAAADPVIGKMAGKGLLQGYSLDLGRHAPACADAGSFSLLKELIGSPVRQPYAAGPCKTGTWFDGALLKDAAGVHGKADPALTAELEGLGLSFSALFGGWNGLTPQELGALEGTSLHDHLAGIGFDRSEMAYAVARCLGTLVTSINNPHDICAGEVVERLSRLHAAAARPQGEAAPSASSPEDVAAGWAAEVAGRFAELGGVLRLGAALKSIEIRDGRVAGVVIETGEDEEESLDASAVVFTPPVPDLFTYAPESHFPADFVSRVNQLSGYGSIAPCFGLSDLVIPDDHAERLINTACVVSRKEGFDWDIYMSWRVRSYTDASCAPAGKHLLTAYLPVSEAEALNPPKVARIIAAIPVFLESAYPEFLDTVEWELYPVCWKAMGAVVSVDQPERLKVEVKAPGVEGLFFAGDTVRCRGAGVDCSCSSGILCASAVTGTDFGAL